MILSQTAMADDTKVAEELLKSKINAVILVLEKKELEQQTQKKEIIEIVMPIFDFSLMAKLALGKKYWSGLTKEKKQRFSELFIKLLKDSYSEKILLYTDEKIHFETPVQVKKKVHVPTVLISKNNKISMLYKLYKSKNSWRVYDIEVQGVSLISTYRSQFDEVLRTGTIDDLLLKLEKPKNK